jgi:hypothetical protein
MLMPNYLATAEAVRRTPVRRSAATAIEDLPNEKISPENHRRAGGADPAVAPTFGGRFQQTQILRFPKMLESAKFG